MDSRIVTIRQLSSGRFLDAYQNQANDFMAVTRPLQNDDTQRWRVFPYGDLYRVQQVSSGRFMDAYQNNANGFSAVTRQFQGNDTQKWIFVSQANLDGGANNYTIRQLSTGRFLDAHQNQANDFSVVTRPEQNNATQLWEVDQV